MSEATITNNTQPETFKCEVCNVTCTCQNLLQIHKQGNKHTISSANAPPLATETLLEHLENNKPHSIYCHLCNVVCNNQEIFQKHVLGKKHSAKAIIQLASANGFIVPTSKSSSGSRKKPNAFQCGLCKITCTSNELLSMHIAGKKHFNKLKESGLIPNVPLTAIASLEAPMQNSESHEGKSVNSDGNNGNGKRAGSHVDVESKKQKMLQGGAALDAIRTCTLCNVVCNSDTVYRAHLAGQKHVAMAMKQAAETLITGTFMRTIANITWLSFL
ncbi:hypothetical protein QVD17_01617 [Tagetes erecta]|uniref:C2H2-type domain-containing protein n=1 Tax=Tagetes erecta TaxID=13708 RepID=A0AAD8LAX3_TARER|nr:hypothetical protein QVD17_01617 [Tagetes erecta]